MSLYGDLPQAKTGEGKDAPAWSALSRLIPVRKPTPAFAPPPSVLRSGRGAGRGPPPGRGAVRPVAIPDGELDKLPHLTPTPTTASSIFTVNGPIKQEYDPARPNDYEEVVKERERKKRDAEQEEERLAEQRAHQAQDDQRLGQAQGEGDVGQPAPQVLPSAERSATLDISGEEAWLRRAGLSRAGTAAAMAVASSSSGPSTTESEGEDARSDLPKGKSLAQKLMEKMGWKEGSGLGKFGQGIATPLMAQKTDKRSGIIIAAEGNKTRTLGEMGPPDKKQRTGAVFTGTPTRVVCLRNMVGPGEVDEDLEDEVGTELLKYGQVTGVLIFEVTEPDYTPEEAVRIFVQFDRVESATKALVDLSGRFFGGHQVRACFFSEERFDKTDLAPTAGEFEAPAGS